MKKMGKVAVDIVTESRKFLGHPYMGHSILVIYVLHLHLHYTVKLLIEAPSVASTEDAARRLLETRLL